MHCTKNPKAKGFYFLQVCRPEDAGMNLGAFLSGTKWLKALSNKSHMIFFPFLSTTRVTVKASAHLVVSKVSPLRSPGTSSWLSCGG